MNIEDSYKIGIKLDVHGTAYTKFNELVKVMDKLNEKIKITTELFKRFNRTFETTSTVFKSMSSTINTAGLKINTLGNRFDRLTMKMNRATAEAHQFGVAIATQGTMGRIGGGGGGGMHGGYRHSPAGFFAHGAEMRGASRLIGLIGAGAMGGMVGIAALGAGFLLKKSFDAGSSVQAQTMALKGIGFGQKFVANALSDSANQNIPGVSNIDYLTAVQEAAAVSRHAKDALALAPWLAKQTFANKNLYTTHGRKFTDVDQMNVVRFAELYENSHKASKIKEGLDVAQQMWSGEGGKIASYDLYGFARRYSVGLPMMSQKGLFELLPVIQKTGGSQLGAMMRVMNSLFVRGQNMHTGKKARILMRHLGLTYEKGHLKDYALWQQYPMEWINKFYVPQLAKHGITKKEDILKISTQAFPGRLSNLIALGYLNRSQEEEAALTSQKSFKTQSAFNASQKLNIAAEGRVSASWTKFASALSVLTSPTIVGGLDSVSKFLDALSKRLNQFENWGANIRKDHKGVGDYLSHGLFGSQWFHNHFGNTVKTAPSSSSNSTHVTLNMDGKTLTNGVINHMNKSANAPLSSGNALHTNLALIPSGLNYLSGGL